MAIQTTNYKLTKPSLNDKVDVNVLNRNADIIDLALHVLNEGKQDKLTFDDEPTANSANPVTSGGVKTALDKKLDSEDYTLFAGASGENPGAVGIVPAPALENMYLGSGGAWETPDAAPTKGSNKLITSGAVKDALDVTVTAETIQSALGYTPVGEQQLEDMGTGITNRLKSGAIADAELHLGFYRDEDGAVCQKEDPEAEEVATDATMEEILSAIVESNLYLKNIAQQEKFDITDITTLKNISDSGLARQYVNIGDQIVVQYTDTAGTVYEMPWDIVHIGDAKLANGKLKKDAIYLQSHYATVEGVQWDKEEKEVATEETAQEGLFYYVPNGEGFKLLNIAVGAAIPYATYDGKVYRNAIKDPTGDICRYGYNRETHAAMPQWLTSTADKGAWWVAKHVGDVAPDQLNSVRGFLAGLPADFVSCMEEVEITQALNAVSEPDKTIGKETYTAKVFLPRLEQMYIQMQVAGIEGEAWDYYKQLAQGAGLTGVFQWYPTTYDALKSYALDNHSAAHTLRLSSADRGNSCNPWIVNSSGYVGSNIAHYAFRCRPACVI